MRRKRKRRPLSSRPRSAAGLQNLPLQTANRWLRSLADLPKLRTLLLTRRRSEAGRQRSAPKLLLKRTTNSRRPTITRPRLSWQRSVVVRLRSKLLLLQPSRLQLHNPQRREAARRRLQMIPRNTQQSRIHLLLVSATAGALEVQPPRSQLMPQTLPTNLKTS